MAMSLSANVITKNFVMEDMTFNAVTTTSKSCEIFFPIDDCKGEFDLVLDNSKSASAALNLIVNGGVGPAAMKDTVYTVPAGSVCRISFATGQVMNAGGLFKGKLTSTDSLATMNVRVAVIKRRYVTNH